MNQENNAFTKVLKSVATVKEIAATAAQFRAYSDQVDDLIAYDVSVGTTKIHVTEGGGGDLIWWWDGAKKKSPLAGSLDVTDDSVVVYTSDIRNGGRHYNMLAVSPEKRLWTFDGRGRHGLSADVAILGSRVYCLEAAGPLQYKWLVSVDLKTGKDRRVHYEEHELSATLALVRPRLRVSAHVVLSPRAASSPPPRRRRCAPCQSHQSRQPRQSHAAARRT
jgi:hypothetical protein